MGTATTATHRAARPAEGTLVAHFRRQVAEQPGAVAMYRHAGGRWQGTTWAQFGEQAHVLAAYLVGEGVPEHGHVAIWAGNRPEWHIASAAILSARARPVPIYLTLSADQAAYELGHSECIVAVVESAVQLEKVLSVADRLPALRRVVVLDSAELATTGIAVSWEAAKECGRALLDELGGGEVERRAAAVRPDDVATLVYTSGTTGPPKAVVATHRNVVAAVEALGPLVPARADDRVLSYLPLAHIVERLNSEFRQYVFGNPVWFASSLIALPGHLREVRPTFFFGVPRVWEKMADAMERQIAGSPAPRRLLARWAIAVGFDAVDRRQRGEALSRVRRLHLALADRLVLARARRSLGLDQAGMIASGAAPIATDILRLFHALGLEICEGYGMTENMASTSMNRRGHARIGTVGPPVPGVEVRIAEDGEILTRGEVVFAGYHKDPAATAAAVVDGWLHTGDIGSLDEDGYLRITDRKKDLIITAGGKNISPTNIETALEAHPLIASAVVIGDRRPHLTALLTLDGTAVRELTGDRPRDPTGDPAVLDAIRRHIEAVNSRLANVETVKRWTLLPREFTVGEELTPTFKVRRGVVAERYAAEIEAMYAAPQHSEAA
jgi:long-chain acyl-CoA synthetase